MITHSSHNPIEISQRSVLVSVLSFPSGTVGGTAAPSRKTLMKTYARALPYLLSWGVLAFLMVIIACR